MGSRCLSPLLPPTPQKHMSRPTSLCRTLSDDTVWYVVCKQMLCCCGNGECACAKTAGWSTEECRSRSLLIVTIGRDRHAANCTCRATGLNVTLHTARSSYNEPWLSLNNINWLDFRNVEEECLLRGTNCLYMTSYLHEPQALKVSKFDIVQSCT